MRVVCRYGVGYTSMIWFDKDNGDLLSEVDEPPPPPAPPLLPTPATADARNDDDVVDGGGEDWPKAFC